MEDVKGLIAIPGLIGALTGGSYLDASMMASALRKEPGMTPKHYGMMLAMRHKAQKAKKKDAEEDEKTFYID